MTTARLLTFVLAGVAIFATPVFAQEHSEIDVAVDTPVVWEGDAVSGTVRANVPLAEVFVNWSDPFGGVWYSTRVTPRGNEEVRFSFQAVGGVTPVGFVQASFGDYAGVVPLAVLPKNDVSWNSFAVVADKPPVFSTPTAVACRRLGITASIATGYVEGLTACRSGLRPMITGLCSPGTLSISAETVTAAAAEYDRTGSVKALERTPSLADPKETARLADEISRQVPLARRLAPMCLVVADSPSAARGVTAIDYSFADYDVRAFRTFLRTRLSNPDSAASHWRTPAADISSLVPGTAREIKTEIEKDPDSLIDISPWALHREYTDASLSQALKGLSTAAVQAAGSPDAESFNWSLTTPVSAISGLPGPCAYGGYDYEVLPSSANVLMLSADAPPWSWQLARDLAHDGKVLVHIDAKSKNAAQSVWRALGAGVSGLIIGNLDGMLKESVAPPAPKARTAAVPAAAAPAPATLADTLTEVAAGLRDLVAVSGNDAPVGIVYSAAAVRAGWFLDYLAAEGTAPAGPECGTRALAAWSEVLADIGVDFKWVSLPEVAGGILAQERYTALILPEVWCVDSATADALAAYVKQGGTLIADNGAGLLDGEYCAQRISPLDELFGVRRRPLVGQRGKLLAPGAAHDPKKDTAADGTLVSARAAAAEHTTVSAGASSAPTVILNPNGEGGTVYLNMFVEPYLDTDKDVKDTVRAAVEKAFGAALIKRSTFVLQNNKPVPARISTRVFGRTRIIFIEPAEVPDRKTLLEIRLPVAGDYYNLRPSKDEGEYLGNDSTFFMPPPASGPIVLALEPFPLTGLPVDLEYGAKAISIRATLEARQDVGDRLFRIELYGPSGEHFGQFDRTVAVAKGVFTGSVDIPDNAPPGPWRVLVRDLESGMASWADVDVR